MKQDFAVIFDMDGVLFDSESCYVKAYVKHAPELPDIEAVCLSCIGANGRKTKEIFLEKYGADFPFDDYYQKVRADVRSHPIPLKPGAVEILKFLQENHIPAALASSTSTETVTKMLREAGLLGYFREIVCGDMVSHSKPHPEIFLVAAEKLGVKPEDAYIIEDSFNGIRAAAASGAVAVMTPDVLMPDESILEQADYLFPSLDDVRLFFSERIKSAENTYTMRLTPKPFAQIASGEKTIELRLYDEKRRKLAVGDTLRFIQTETQEELLTKIEAIYIYDSFKELYNNLPLRLCGYSEDELPAAKPEDMNAYYSEEDRSRYRAVGIRIRRM